MKKVEEAKLELGRPAEGIVHRQEMMPWDCEGTIRVKK